MVFATIFEWVQTLCSASTPSAARRRGWRRLAGLPPPAVSVLEALDAIARHPPDRTRPALQRNGVWGGGGGRERDREWLVRVRFQTIKCVFLGHPIHFRKI